MVSYTYNSYNGKLATMTYGNGTKVEYVYDELDRVSEVWYTKNSTRTKAYSMSTMPTAICSWLSSMRRMTSIISSPPISFMT